jgi:SAM-dependent methyltransferase
MPASRGVQGLLAVMWTEIVWGLLALRMAAGAARVGGALRRLEIVENSGENVAFSSVVGPAATLTPSQCSAAAAFAAERDLDVLHLVPRTCSVGYAWMAGFVLDRAGNDEWLEAKTTTGWASVVRDDLLGRAGLTLPERVEDPAKLAVLQKKLARYGRSGVAVLSDGVLDGPDPFVDRAVLEEALNAGQALIIGPPLVIALLIAGPFVAPWMGTLALVLFALQQIIALASSPVAVPAAALILSPLSRPFWQVGRWLRTLLAPARRLHRAEAEALRPVYAELMGDGLDRFFEPRAEACPLCDGAELVQSLRTGDSWQGKPGTFTLDRCVACDHIFQNPRLNVDGLGFYYRDFYDGLGGEDVETLFASTSQPYTERVEMVMAHATPTRWLDVGCGHGHFCARGKQALPDCTFDGLDLSDGVIDAQRRGWLETAHRGLFPELADSLAGQYDAVSMSHYLEHTTDPRAEIAAASTVLRSGGHLMIEVPNPESWMGRVLGSFWIPWFQPQHLNFVSVGNLTRLFEEHGLDAVQWHRREAHIPADLLLAVWALLRRISPAPGMPWDPPTGVIGRAWHGVVGGLGIFLLIAAVIADKLTAPLVAATGGSNAYRVVARKR